MKLFEQFLRNKHRQYYHGSPIKYDEIKGVDYVDGIRCAFVTTDRLYACKYAKDKWFPGKKKGDTGWVYRVQFTMIPDIFDANNPKDIKRWKEHYSLDTFFLSGIQKTDWHFSCPLAFHKQRYEVIKCLFELGYDGFSNYEREKLDENHHSICIFKPESKLRILSIEKPKDIYNEKDVRTEITMESMRAVFKKHNKRDFKSDRIPDKWIDKKVQLLQLQENWVDNVYKQCIQERGFCFLDD